MRKQESLRNESAGIDGVIISHFEPNMILKQWRVDSNVNDNWMYKDKWSHHSLNNTNL